MLCVYVYRAHFRSQAKIGPGSEIWLYYSNIVNLALHICSLSYRSLSYSFAISFDTNYRKKEQHVMMQEIGYGMDGS